MFRNPPADPIERIDPVEPIERIDPDDPIDSIEPAEPMDPMLPMLKALPADATDANDQRHRIDATLCFDQGDGADSRRDSGRSIPSLGTARGAVLGWRREIV